MADREVFNALLQVLYYLSLLCQMAIAVLAFVRFKLTASGLLIGGAFAATVVLSLLFKAVQSALNLASSPGSDSMLALFGAKSVLLAVLSLLVVAGVAFIPASLQKLARATRG